MTRYRRGRRRRIRRFAAKLEREQLQQSEIIDRLRALAKRRRWYKKTAYGLGWAIYPTIVLTLITALWVLITNGNFSLNVVPNSWTLMESTWPTNGQGPPTTTFGGMWFWSVVAMIFIRRRLRTAGDQQTVLTNYVDMQDPQSVPVLIEALDLDDKTLKRGVQEGLADLLPRLGPDELVDLTTDHLHSLRTAFPTAAPAFADAVLKVWEQIGGEDEANVLGVILEKPKRSRTAEQIVEIQRVNDLLRKRIAENILSQTLLRPAQGGGEEALLRPASGIGQVVDENLLRPVGVEEGEGNSVRAYAEPEKEDQTVAAK
jgi:hypothetical protein